MACTGIDIGSAFDCENPIVAAVNQRLILINQNDYNEAVVTYDGTLTSLIANIVLAAGGKQGYAFEGIRATLQPQSAFIPGVSSSGYDHQLDFVVFDISQEQKDNLQKMGLGKMVAIVENANAVGNANSVFEVFGKDVGLELITNVRINGDQDTSGGFAIQLKTSDNQGKEPKLPTSWWDTDYLTTKAKVDTLLIPTV